MIRKLPLLDVKMWIEERNNDKNEPTKIVLYEFYSKDIATKTVIPAKSAMPTPTKRTILTQEILRVLLRCSPLLPWETTVNHIHSYLQRMQFSEYPITFRAQVLQSALHAYECIKELDARNITPMYRPKEWKRN